MLKGKKIVIGITAGIAAYKIPHLIRLFIKEGAEVKVVMTHAACDFVTPLTLSVVSQNVVAIEPFDKSTGAWNSHIELGIWADAMIFAPLTANTMAKMATGITDNLLTAVYLASRCPVFIAPTMDVDMYMKPTTQENIKKLVSLGNILIEPTAGFLASGLSGMGRMEEPENIVAFVAHYFSGKEDLKGKKVLISSGPTIEYIDPVRYISNHSSGKMGNAIALEAARRGAEVILVSGPVQNYPQHANIKVIKVTSAQEMYDHCLTHYEHANIAIMTAAVADFVPLDYSNNKIKKTDEAFNLSLTKSKDILLELGKRKKNQILIGFSLETDNELENAKGKLAHKNLDFIVLNSLQDKGAGFNYDTNKIKIIKKTGEIIPFELKSKPEVAKDIMDVLSSEIIK